MAHLTIYRHDMTPAAWETEKLYSGLGRLPDAVEPRTHRAVNGDWSFTMRYPLTGSNYAELQKGRLICAEGQLYRISKIRKSDKAPGREIRVDALHILYDLRKKEITNIETDETDPGGISQAAALGLVLAGTPFSVGTVDNTETMDYLDVLQKPAFTVLKEQVLTLWGGELEPDNWTVNIRAQLGQDRRFPIRRGVNIRGIEYTEDIEGIITRLHVSGYQGATFEEINGGLDYIDSANIGAYRFLGAGAGLEGRVEFPDDDEPGVLLEKAQAHLATVDVPQISYDIDLLDLRNSEQYKLYKPLTVHGLGDTSVIHHDFFNVDIVARAMELERDPVLEENVGVVLGNYTKDLYRALSGASAAAAVIDSIVSAGGTLRGEKLRGTINLLQTQLHASGAYATAEVLGNKGLLLENTNPASADYGAMYMGPGLFAIANSKKPDNSWDWKTWGGPGGFAGYLILAHTIDTEQLKAAAVTSETIKAGAVTAEKLNADEIFANTAYVAKLVTSLISSDLGQRLVLTSNTGIQAIVNDVDNLDERLGGAETSLNLLPGQITAEIDAAAEGLQTQINAVPGQISAAVEDTENTLRGEFGLTTEEIFLQLLDKQSKVAGVTIQPGLVEILGHVIRMITDQMYVSDTTDEATAAILIDAVSKIVRANALQVKALHLEGNLTGANNVMLKGSLSVLPVPAGSNLPAIEAALPKYLENDLTVNVAAGTYNVGNWIIKNHTGGHIRWVFAAGVTILATSIELLNNPSGVSFVGNSSNYAQIIVTNLNNVIFGKRSGGEFAYLRLTGKVRTGAADGTAHGVQFEDCAGLYIHNDIVERTRLYTMYIDRCSGAYIVDNVGGYYQGDYTTLANTGEGVLIIRGAGAVQNSVPMSNTNPVVSWLGTLQQYNISQAASPGAPSAPVTQTVRYVLNSNYYCDLPSSAGMATAVANWNSGAPRGGLSSTDRRYAGMWLLKLEGGAVQNVLTGLAGKTILAANLTVHCDAWNGSGTGSKDLFYMLHGAAPPSGASAGSRLADTGYNLAPADGTTQTLNLTGWLQAMVNAGTAFYGFGIGTEGTYARYDSTCTLEITYQV